MKKIILTLTLCLLSIVASAKKSTYIYTDNFFDYVKLEEMGKKEKITANHPFTFTRDQMDAILKEIKLNRSFVVKKEVETQEIFDERAIKSLSPKLVEAFLKAAPGDKIIFSYLTKDPKFFMRDDRLTICTAWVENSELHIVFNKLFAKLTGDYDKRSDFSKIIARSTGLRTSLDVREGQILGKSSELIIDTNYNFGQAAQTDNNAIAVTTPAKPEEPKSTKKRLIELKNLKKDGLITDGEYKTKREEILKGL